MRSRIVLLLRHACSSRRADPIASLVLLETRDPQSWARSQDPDLGPHLFSDKERLTSMSLARPDSLEARVAH
jgi:hypothetical protein